MFTLYWQLFWKRKARGQSRIWICDGSAGCQNESHRWWHSWQPSQVHNRFTDNVLWHCQVAFAVYLTHKSWHLTVVLIWLGGTPLVYSKTWLKRPLWIAATCFQRPLLCARTVKFIQKVGTANSNHTATVSTKTTFICTRGWSFWRGFTVLFTLYGPEILWLVGLSIAKKFIASLVGTKLIFNGVRLHLVIVSAIQWKPFWLATQLYPQNDWIGWQFPVYYDVCAQAPFTASLPCLAVIHFISTHDATLKCVASCVAANEMKNWRAWIAYGTQCLTQSSLD